MEALNVCVFVGAFLWVLEVPEGAFAGKCERGDEKKDGEGLNE